ncbi:GNAT family N-acetyltransferase [Micromonospora sp. BQ11]|uniref:GNAT family N-acetyltransferase n=1 Tax=Micromonospora sp. BQ11 TaxID=3452212 RepID=UPI003F8BD8D8
MLFDPQPVLHGDLVGVRPLRSGDFDELHQVARDPLIWEQHPVKDRYRYEAFRLFFADSLASGGALAVTSTTGDIIGSSRFHAFDQRRDEVEIGWTFLARSFWGGQANGELKALMVGHAFRFVERVVFLVGPDNRRSQRALEKIGAVRVGRRPDASGHDSLLFEVRRPPVGSLVPGRQSISVSCRDAGQTAQGGSAGT